MMLLVYVQVYIRRVASFVGTRSDTQRMFVDFGLGFHVEFTWSEALNFIALREEKRARLQG
ncbi:c-myc binding family protein [Salix suchowensis]|nr:c-myc binding family protein [Salix suchowensis]